MTKVSRFVIWICSKFNRQQIELIVNELLDVLNNRNPEVKPKDEFKERHPQYRKFSVDPNPPLKEKPSRKQKRKTKNYKLILAEHEAVHGKQLRPVKHYPASPKIPRVFCPDCSAPHQYLYYNDGNKRSQIRCKVCNHLFQLDNPFHKKKPNITAHIARWPCLSGKFVKKSPSINVVMITVHTVSKILTSLMQLSVFYAKSVLHNSNSAISTGSIIVSPVRFNTLHP
jgi:hypothetical protein